MNSKIINIIFERFHSINHQPETELKYPNNFTLLVAIILSAQATDKSVNMATDKLFKVASTPQQIIDLGLDKLIFYIRSVGLYNNKSKNIMLLAHKLIQEYNSEIPNDFTILQTLPGIGRKTANVFLNCALGLDTIAVDTHVFRVSNRIGLVKANSTLKVELALLKNIPKKWHKYAHHWLILHGRYTCRARKPNCTDCLINDLCEYPLKNN